MVDNVGTFIRKLLLLKPLSQSILKQLHLMFAVYLPKKVNKFNLKVSFTTFNFKSLGCTNFKMTKLVTK